MGRGKGDFKSYVFKALKGRLLFEAKNTVPVNAKRALNIALKKLPIRCQVIAKGL
jgi:ribosomal protein L16/L10AE